MTDAAPPIQPADSAKASQAAQILGRTLQTAEVAPGARLGTDLVLAEGPNGRDLTFVEGLDALGQDLKTAILTPLGEDLFHMAFGFEALRAMTRSGGIRHTEEMLRVSAMHVVISDARISRVVEVDVERVDPQLRAWRIVVTAQTVLDDIIKLTLGEVGQDA